MTNSSTTDFDLIFIENAEVGEATISSGSSTVSDLEFMNVAANNNDKTDTIASKEGVAKLSFGFIDDMQGGDSSLEPGEVKTPPPGSSPNILKESTPSRLTQARAELPAKQLAKETLAKALKTVSQLEAEACEEKVRAILELDAKRRKEEAEKRKLEAEKRRQSGETDFELERERQAKEERKRLKKLKRAKKAAKQALISFEEDDEKVTISKKRKVIKTTESEESEGLCSSGADDEVVTSKSDKHSSILNSAIAIPSVPQLRYAPHLPPPHLLPDAFIGGFRHMNPFLHSARPDFSHSRGGFLPRGRGLMRGRLPFQGFRPPFFSNSGVNSAQLKFNTSLGLHGMQQQRHHTPPPNRGHSPILPPLSDLQWTKCKPSLSYAFKFNEDHKFLGISNQNRHNSEENLHDEDPGAGDGQEHGSHQKFQHEQVAKKDKKQKCILEEKKKFKKQKGKDLDKSKSIRTSLQIITSTTKQKKKSRKSSRRKIEKIRKSYGSSNRTTPIQQQGKSVDTEIPHKSLQEVMPNDDEIRNKVENIKKEKIETTQPKIKDLTLKVKPLIMVKTEPHEKETEKKESQEITKSREDDNKFDATKIKLDKVLTQEYKVDELGSVTPPLPSSSDAKGKKTSSLQNALEIQKRIDKLLQQDDIKLEAIEAAKDLLMKKTQKHQSSKEKLLPEREAKKVSEQKPAEHIKPISQKEESTQVKEKPKAYKGKDTDKKHKDINKDMENNRMCSKNQENTDYKLKDKYTDSSIKDISKDERVDNKKSKNHEKDRDKTRKSEKDNDKDKSRKEPGSVTYRNPFKRSLSRDRFFGKIGSQRRTRTKSRERDLSTKRRLSSDRKRADSSGYSSSKVSSNRRYSGSSAASKSGDRDIKGSLDSLHSKEKDQQGLKREITSESKFKFKRSTSPKRKGDKVKDISTKSKQGDKTREKNFKSTTPPKLIKNEDKSQENSQLIDHKKSKSPVKSASKKRPLSFTQTEFLFPEEGNEDDFILGDDEETGSFKNLKSPSDKENSPDTDDYMDNWENDEDVDLDMNSNMPMDISTSRKLSPELMEDSFVSRFVNPSPPKELLEKHIEPKTQNKKESEKGFSQPLTPPLDLLKKMSESPAPEEIQQECRKDSKSISEVKRPELFGMQELYDQFIRSVEASGVSIKTANKEQAKHLEVASQEKPIITNNINGTQNQSEDPLSTSSTSTSTSSSTSSSSSSSSESNSSSNSSSSSSSESSSEESNDGEDFPNLKKDHNKKVKLQESMSPKCSSNTEKISGDSGNCDIKSFNIPSDQIDEREPRTPSPSPLQKSVFIAKTSYTPTSENKTTPKSDVAKDFKKLKSLEANLSRIQMMRANYDSNDEISEELQKMEMLFLQEKKIILQKYAKNTQPAEKPATMKPIAETTCEFLPALPVNEFGALPPLPPPEEPNKIFDVNREAIKLTISPLKLPSKPAIFDVSLTEETDKKVSDDKDELDFTEKLVKPAKEVAIVKPIMETKESKESRTRDSHRHRRSPGYGSSRERQRSPGNYRDRNRRSTSRNRFSPQRRGRGRSLSISPPRRNFGTRHGTPPRRGPLVGRFRASNRRSRSRSRSPLRHFVSRRTKETSPLRRKRGQQQDLQTHYKKFGRHRGSRSRSPRSPQTRPRSPRTPPPRRRSYSQDPYSRSPLPFKPPSPPTRRSLSPTSSPSSPTRRSRSPPSPRRPRSPRSPRSPVSPRSPRSPDSPPHRYDDHRYRLEKSFDRHSSISPHPQYYAQDSLATVTSSQAPSYYYDVSPNRISLDARINIVLNTPGSGIDTPTVSYGGYTNYTQYGGAAYMSIPPQPMANPANNMGYYSNPYVPMIPSTHEGHHSILPPHGHGIQQSIHQSQLQQQSPPAYSNIPTINRGIASATSPLPQNNFYFNEFNGGHQSSNSVLKELPKAPVAVQKGNVLEIVPSNVESAHSLKSENNTKSSPVLVETVKNHIDKIASISWKDEVNNRHVKAAVMRLNRGAESAMRSILKRSEGTEKLDKTEKKKVYFEDGIYPSRDSEDEDRKLVEYKIRKKVLRLRKKRGIDIPAARDLMEEQIKLQIPKREATLQKLPPPPPPASMPPANSEQPIYLRPPTPIPIVYFHFDPVVHSMYISQLEKPIPPRLLNPKCMPPIAAPATTGSGNVGNTGGASTNASNLSPNLNLPCAGPTTKKELTTLAALNRVSRNENVMNSPKSMGDPKRESPNSQQSPIMSVNKPINMNFTPPQASPHMSPLHGPVIRHPPSPIGFVGMRINNFMRLPPSPLARVAVPSHMQAPPPNMINMPPGIVGLRHPHYNMPPPNLIPPSIPPDANYNPIMGGAPYNGIQAPPPGYQGYGQRPMNPCFFMGPAPSHTMHPPPPIPVNHHGKEKDHMLHNQHHHPSHPHAHIHPQQQHSQNQHKPPPPLPLPIRTNSVAANPQAMVAPYNVKKTVN